MGWQDAPVAEDAPKAKWQDAPMVKGSKAMGEQPYEKEAKELIGTSVPELISAHPLVRTATSAMRMPLVGTAKVADLLGDKTGIETINKLDQMQARGAKALGYDKPSKGFEKLPAPTTTQDVVGSLLPGVALSKLPVVKNALARIAQAVGIGGVAGATSDPNKTVVPGAEGAATAGAITTALEGLLKVPGAARAVASFIPRFLGKEAPKSTVPGPTTAGAERVAGELQRQRDVLAGKQPVRQGPVPHVSALEDKMIALEQETKPLRDAAFNSGARVSADDALSMIERLKSKNVDRGVLRSLDEVAATIKDAANKGASATLPSAGTRMTPAQLKQLQQGGGSMDIPMLDEVRQSINRMISGKGEKALDSYTQKLLATVRDDLTGRAPPQYREYLKKYAEGERAIDPFREAGSASSKVTTEPGMTPIKGGDAQEALNKVFNGDHAERHFAELVRDTAHSKQAQADLREGLAKWIMPTDQAGKVNIDTAASHWNKAKEAVKKSGMLKESHYNAVDKVMTGLATAKKANHLNETMAAGAAWFLGWSIGRPGTSAMLARSAASRMGGVEKTPGEIVQMIQKMIDNPEVAKAAAATPTQANLATFERLMAVESGQQSPRGKRQASSPRELGMRPGGL